MPSHAQGGSDTTPCGLANAIDYPIDGVSIDYEDFGMYRAGFNGGRHSGIDIAFGRYGDPVRAAARGQVTYSDVNGWDIEKGVVIIQHFFPDGQTYYTLYGHMEEVNGIHFPKVGQCVEKGDIIGAVGHPAAEAPHLHYETRTRAGISGGPGYFTNDPLDAGWMHPIDFTESWKLRFSSAFRSMITAGGGPTAQPIFDADGRVTFAEQYHLEQRDGTGNRLWRLDVQGLVGILELPDGRILGSTSEDQIIIVDNGRFADTWKADHPLRSVPMLLDDALVFVTNDNRVVSYNLDGSVRWQTEPLGDYIENYVQSGNRLALSSEQAGTFKLIVVDSSGAILYKATANAPATLNAAENGFYIMAGNQIGLLDHDLKWTPLIQTAQTLNHGSQIAVDAHQDIIVYPGSGDQIYAYSLIDGMRWQAKLPTFPRQPPLLGLGSGCLAYTLTSDGTLAAYSMANGALRGLTTLFAGGSQGHLAARFLKVSPTDQVQFSAGYLSIATIDGPTLANAHC